MCDEQQSNDANEACVSVGTRACGARVDGLRLLEDDLLLRHHLDGKRDVIGFLLCTTVHLRASTSHRTHWSCVKPKLAS